MDAGRWETVREVFGGTLEQDPEERTGYLWRSCAGDRGLRAEVESLLEAHDAAGGFMELPLPETTFPRRIGAYELERCLGRGGMGAVYAAVRVGRDPAERVAIKLLRPYLDFEEIVQRFRIERLILSRLDHPLIVRLLDGGTTDGGLPFLVMEFVEGRPIDEHCDARRLTATERIALFRKVCMAVEFVHRNLVVHCDLKPSNILVTRDGELKLLDFGIARVLDSELLDPEPAPISPAIPSLRLMTPHYASPEQMAGEPVSFASDVYSLGVLLYYLLSGRLPFDMRRSTPESLAAIRDAAPAPPSRVARTVGLDLGLSGDLDDVVLRALHNEPDKRYASAEQLSGDLDRCQPR